MWERTFLPADMMFGGEAPRLFCKRRLCGEGIPVGNVSEIQNSDRL